MMFTDIKKRNKIKLAVLVALSAVLVGCAAPKAEETANIEVEISETESSEIEEAALNREESSEIGDSSNIKTSKTEKSVTGNTETMDHAGIDDATIGQGIDAETAGTQEIDEIEKKEPVKVKGIYVTGPIAGTAKMDELIQLVEDTELNAFVIDVKDDNGRITYKMQSEVIPDLTGINYIPDIQELIQTCKEKDIYLIARVVAFKDSYLAEQHPEYAIKKKNGEVYYDTQGLAWVNPYNRQVWDYLVEVGTQAALAGFDEIQFDYVRFSTDLKTSQLDFGEEAEGISKTEIITAFVKYAYEQLSKFGVYVSADVFGTVIDSKVDQEIVGQSYAEMAEYLDYICPMVYPSHYANGVYGIAVPDAKPYQTIKAAMSAAEKELEVLPEERRAKNRAWLQGFTASWVEGHISYGAEQLREQIQGAYEAGCDEWIVWNAAVRYPRENFLTKEEEQNQEQQSEEQQNQVEQSQEQQSEEQQKQEEQSQE